jgi:hypothetical protein
MRQAADNKTQGTAAAHAASKFSTKNVAYAFCIRTLINSTFLTMTVVVMANMTKFMRT